METNVKNRFGANPANLARRDFLQAAKGAGMLSALAVLLGKGAAVEMAMAEAAPLDAISEGYRETEHIRKYYRCAAYW